MSLERQYIQKFMNESKKQVKKFEESGFKYAYNTKDHAESEYGYEVQDSLKELENAWDEDYGKFSPTKMLVMKPTTSVDKAMVCTATIDGYLIYPSINAAINGSNGFLAFGGGENSDITQEEIQELLQTKDLKRAKVLLNNIFDHPQNYGGFVDLYEYVSGPMPMEDGWTPGKILVQNKVKASPRDFEYYKRRVIANPSNLKSVPAKFKTPELCEIAVSAKASAIEYVPDELKTPELCKIAVEKGGLVYIPSEFITPELCKIAVEEDGHTLRLVPDELKTPELCKIAVSNWSIALEHVPDELKTPELCKIAAEKTGWTLKYVPDELKTPELCKIAVSNWGDALEHVPDELKTPELCKIAVEDMGTALEYVPDHLKEQIKQELGIK